MPLAFRKVLNKQVLPEPDLSLLHLQAELARIDVLIQREVRCWQLAGQDPTDIYRGLYVSDTEAEALLARPLGGNWGQTASLPPQEALAFEAAEERAEAEIQAIVAAAQSQNVLLRLPALAAAFNLDRFERDALLVALAPSLDLRYERLYVYLQDDLNRKRPSVNLAFDLLAESGSERLRRLVCFAADAPLVRYRLLERVADSHPAGGPLLRETLRVDETVVAWLLGRYQPHPDLAGHAVLLEPLETGPDHLLAAPAAPELARLAGANPLPIAIFYGPDSLSQEAAARLLAAHLGRFLLKVDLAAVVEEKELPPRQALATALRDARLTGAAAYLGGWDACLGDDGAIRPDLLAEICAYPGLAIAAGQQRWPAGGLERSRELYWLEFPLPPYPQRLKLWEYYLAAGLSANIDLSPLAEGFALTTGQIRDAVTSARDGAAQRGTGLQTQDLLAAARLHSNPRLAALARKIMPRYTWTDLILPPDQHTLLREIVATVRGRPIVLHAWGAGQKLASSAGVTILFAGPPGTGKTMAAEVMAHELGLDLYKIDLSSVVSKYIGETEKNLERIFNEAQNSNAILMFDEADAIFGKRSEVKDAHDRYANIEISYLLQRMETYDGVTILATNLRANLDEAFTRRLHFIVEFPFPEEADRLRIWQTLFPPGVPRVPDLDFGGLARRFKLAGGNIRNAILSAAYQAAANGGEVTLAYLLHGARREMQKMGRLIQEEDGLNRRAVNSPDTKENKP